MEYDLAEIERRAYAALPHREASGPWRVSCLRRRERAYDNVDGVERRGGTQKICLVDCESDGFTGANAEHIAGLDPVVVLAMCRDLRALQAAAAASRRR